MKSVLKIGTGCRLREKVARRLRQTFGIERARAMGGVTVDAAPVRPRGQRRQEGPVVLVTHHPENQVGRLIREVRLHTGGECSGAGRAVRPIDDQIGIVCNALHPSGEAEPLQRPYQPVVRDGGDRPQRAQARHHGQGVLQVFGDESAQERQVQPEELPLETERQRLAGRVQRGLDQRTEHGRPVERRASSFASFSARVYSARPSRASSTCSGPTAG